jgi:hypothetical protein
MRHTPSRACGAGKLGGLALSLFLVFAISGRTAFGQKKVVKSPVIPVSVHEFELRQEHEDFFLQPLPAREHSRVPIPKEWLAPPQDKADDEDEPPVNPYRYDRRVTSFPIGNGEIGLRFSSFDAMTEGSMAAALGRDVFLIYDPGSGKLRPGGLDLGITKERHFDSGCFHARMVHLMVGDPNQDGLTDIGVVAEEIWCPEIGRDRDSEGEPADNEKLPAELQHLAEIHQYQQHLVVWYVYGPEGWKPSRDPEWVPDNYSELPLIGITMSPVDFVGEVIWHSFNPKLWRTLMYVPEYRKHLIAGGHQSLENNRAELKQEIHRATSK